MNKYLLLSIIVILSLIIIAFGAWARITHQAYADTLLTIGKISQLAGLAALFILLVLWMRKKK